jgi:DNA repair protein RecO (recombination protein O)
MPRSRTYQTEAIIIKKTRLGEADRILTLYTPDMGKIQGVAKGVRRPRSKLSGHLELLTHSMVFLTHGRNLDTIVGSQTIDSFLPLKSNLELGAYALYATELVSQFGAEHQENRRLFSLLLEIMKQLSSQKAAMVPQPMENENHPETSGLLRYFELHLLEEVGYRPQLGQCVSCRKALSDTANYFSASAGGMVCPDCRLKHSYTYPVSPGALNFLHQLQDGDWSTPGELSRDINIHREMEFMIRNYLRYLLEREVRSVAWLDTLRRMHENNP